MTVNPGFTYLPPNHSVPRPDGQIMVRTGGPETEYHAENIRWEAGDFWYKVVAGPKTRFI